MTATATATAKEDKRWSDSKKMEGDDSLRTLECLRGRLLAERQASKVANEEAQLMGIRLEEIENKLREETKLMEKAEKKLKFLMKKIESLKISPTFTFEGLDSEAQSNSSEICRFSCTSSNSSSTSGLIKDHSEESAAAFITAQDIKKITHFSALPRQEDITSDSNFLPKDSLSDKSTYHFTPHSNKHCRSASNSEAPAPPVVMEISENDAKTESDNEQNYVDNSLALVAVDLPMQAAAAPDKTSELMIVNKSVSEVLDGLRHAREKIQSSIERSRRNMNMIRVGPT